MAIPTGNCEAQWIERCCSGDREAFRLLYDAYKDRVYSFALYTLNGDAATAEDFAQDVFVQVFSAYRPVSAGSGVRHMALPNDGEPLRR